MTNSKKGNLSLKRKESGGAAVFIDYIKFQLIQDKCDLINESYLNEDVRIWFNLKGNKWERDGKINYFTNLDAWKVEKTSTATERIRIFRHTQHWRIFHRKTTN